MRWPRSPKAALEVFASYGYYGSTMEKIMKASGMSKGLLYHYFPSKEKVFFHLVDTALEISRNTWQAAFDAPGSRLGEDRKAFRKHRKDRIYR